MRPLSREGADTAPSSNKLTLSDDASVQPINVSVDFGASVSGNLLKCCLDELIIHCEHDPNLRLRGVLAPLVNQIAIGCVPEQKNTESTAIGVETTEELVELWVGDVIRVVLALHVMCWSYANRWKKPSTLPFVYVMSMRFRPSLIGVSFCGLIRFGKNKKLITPTISL
jgi:hypothetical protein